MSEFHRRWDEIVERLSAQGISESERANLRAELRSLAEEWGEHSWAEWRKHAEKISEQFPFMVFREPDFESLYQRKAELDNQLIPSRRGYFSWDALTTWIAILIAPSKYLHDVAQAFERSPRNQPARQYRLGAFILFLCSSLLLVVAAAVHVTAEIAFLSEALGCSGVACLLGSAFCVMRYGSANDHRKPHQDHLLQ